MRHRFAWLGSPSASQPLALAPGTSILNQLAFGADRLLFVYALVVGWLCIYVPWRGRGRYGEVLGYWFLWSPSQWAGSIDLVRLMLELVAATAALVALAVGRERWRRRRLQSRPAFSLSLGTGLATIGIRDVGLTPHAAMGLSGVALTRCAKL